MKIALIGFGKMGKAIAEVAANRNLQLGTNAFEIIHIIDVHNRKDFSISALQDVDVAIEFTSPHTAIDNIYWCFEADVPIVVGSTGWTERLEEVRNYAIKQGKSFLFSPNYSLGVNIFFELNRMMTRIFSLYPEYDVYMEEIHHTEKKDAPSGTALYAALDILNIHPAKESWQNDKVLDKNVLSLVSKREPDVPGTHTITFESDIDKIELTHTAHSRKGFAMGALMAAQWLKDKKGAYTMDDVLGFNK